MSVVTKTEPQLGTTVAPLSFTASKDALKKALATLARIADRKSSIPILGNVAIRAEGDRIVLVATDLNLYAWIRVPANIQGGGGTTVSAKQLADLVKKLPGNEVSFRTTSRAAGGPLSVAVITVDGISATLETRPDRDFPKVPVTSEAKWSSVEAKAFSSLFARTAFSICKDETRFHLNGALLEHDGNLARTVTTDGHRLTKMERSLPADNLRGPGVIIPARGCSEIVKLAGKHKGDCEVAVARPFAFVRCADTTLAIKLIDAQFPPYEQVIPKEYATTVTTDREALIASLERSQLRCSETRGVKLSASPDGLRLTSDNPDTGTTNEDLSAVVSGPSLAIGFNAKYLVELLEQIDSTRVTICLSAELNPALIRSDEYSSSAPYLGVVMPMRI